MSVSFRLLKKLNYFSLDVDFAMGNELLVIEGVSGAGKTTILNCLAGIAVPDEGEIIVDERLIFSHTDKVNVPAEKRNIGYLFQNYALFPHMTVKQNVLYGLKNRKESVSYTHLDVYKRQHYSNVLVCFFVCSISL